MIWETIDYYIDRVLPHVVYPAIFIIIGTVVLVTVKMGEVSVMRSEVLVWVDKNCIDHRFTVGTQRDEYLCDGRWRTFNELWEKQRRGELK